MTGADETVECHCSVRCSPCCCCFLQQVRHFQFLYHVWRVKWAVRGRTILAARDGDDGFGGGHTVAAVATPRCVCLVRSGLRYHPPHRGCESQEFVVLPAYMQRLRHVWFALLVGRCGAGRMRHWLLLFGSTTTSCGVRAWYCEAKVPVPMETGVLLHLGCCDTRVCNVDRRERGRCRRAGRGC